MSWIINCNKTLSMRKTGMSWRTRSSGFLCSLHAWFENIPEREMKEWQRERSREREKREQQERGRKRENKPWERSFFPVARERFKDCPCKEKESKTPFETWMGVQGYRNKGFYLLLTQSNLSGRLRAQLLAWGQQFCHKECIEESKMKQSWNNDQRMKWPIITQVYA